MQEEVERAAALLKDARSIFVLTGAGVSAESGIPTFRDAQTGLWARFDPMTLASPEGFAADPGLVWRWYMSRLDAVAQARPNPGHVALAQLEKIRGNGVAIFTQNVDDLHERAGSRAVHHLHGRITRFRCHECASEHDLTEEEKRAGQPPSCSRCRGLVRPDVVWFGEMLPARSWSWPGTRRAGATS